MKVKSESEVAQSCPTLRDPMDYRLLRPWDFSGKSTRVGCHCLLQGYSLEGRKELDTTEMHAHMQKAFQLGLFKKKHINKRH